MQILRYKNVVNIAKIDTHGWSLDGRKVQRKPSSEKEQFGGLGTSVDPKMLRQIKNLCKMCGQYRSCDDGCKAGKVDGKHIKE